LFTRGRVLFLGFLFLSSLLFLSCGRKGPPVPPEIKVPAAVEKVSAVSRGDRVYLSWARPTKNLSDKPLSLQDLMEFEIFRREVERSGGESSAVSIAKVKAASPDNARIIDGLYTYVDEGGPKGLAFDHQYAYHLRALNFSRQAGPPSREILVTIYPSPLPPVGLKAEAGDGTVLLSWEAPRSRADGRALSRPVLYNIYRGKTPQSYDPEPINPKPITGFTYADVGLANDVGYYYVVRALDDGGPPWHESLESNEAMAIPAHTTPPSPPRNLSFALAPEGVRLAWDSSPEPDLLGYFVYRSLHPKGGYVRLNATPLTTITYLDQTASSHTVYYYAVSAVDASPRQNESELSETVQVEVP